MLPSVLCMCVFSTVLFGSTWAWFTAQSSSNVNEIQAANPFHSQSAQSLRYATGYNFVYANAAAPATLSLEGESESAAPAAPTGYALSYSTGTAETLEDGSISFSKGIFDVKLTLEGTASYGYFGIEIDHPWFDGEPYYFETNALAKGESVDFTVSTGEPMTMRVTSTFCVKDRTVPGLELFDGDTTNGSPYDFSDGELEAQAESIRAGAAAALQAELDRLAAEEAERLAAEEAARLEAERLAAEEAAKKAEEEANANGEAGQTPADPAPTTPENPAPTTPETPAEPVDPAPTTPETPAEPADPAPTTPETPAEPTDPAPTTPETPAEPVDPAPTTPETPAEPTDPAPTTPETPAEPVDPTPTTPETPAEPTDPAPTTPETPAESAPAEPEAASDGDAET